ncbi:hypothetical protein [Serratia liquefaciens]|uniref:hypothetical protein n=1 Tax=Serratia liquefaciens TaxID=614 RepID=UPI003727220A
MKNEKTKYDDVSDILNRLATGKITRRSLQQKASRFKAAGKQTLAENCLAALEHENIKFRHFDQQRSRLGERAEPMTIEEKLKLRLTLDMWNGSTILTDTLVAWQSFFEARGMEVSTGDLFSMWALEKASEFEVLTGESIARQ